MIKENLQSYKHGFSQLFIVLRVMAFEKFTAVFFFFYLVFVLSLAFIFSVFYWVASVVILLSALLLFKTALHNMEFLKRSLIRKNDRVEYADPSSEHTNDMFKTAKVLLKMKASEVKKTSMISDELMEGSKHFYLVQNAEKATVIAYDWIMGLRPELLEELDELQNEERPT
jgi:hypothetical protein